MSIEVIKLNSETFSPDELHNEARHLRQFIYDDFRRIGATEDQARSIANPDSEQDVLAQIDKIICPRYPDTVYAKLASQDETVGYAKIGPRIQGDEAPFGAGPRFLASIRELSRDSLDMPRGLHAFAVKDGLAKAALARVYYDLVPAHQPLVASVPEVDSELHAAFTELGAKEKTPKGIITLGSFAATYSRRVLPPHHGRKTK